MMCEACLCVAYHYHMGFVYAHRYKKTEILADMEIMETVGE